MSGTIAFRPGATLTLSATSSSSGGTIDPSCPTLEIQNVGNEAVFVRWGIGAQTAVVTDYPVMAGQAKKISIGSGNTHVACVTGSGSCTVYVTSGEGL